jgi:hypothetical protein
MSKIINEIYYLKNNYKYMYFRTLKKSKAMLLYKAGSLVLVNFDHFWASFFEVARISINLLEAINYDF